MILASFPSPSRSVWDLGPIPLRAYALCIIAGIIASIWIGERRWVARGGKNGTVSDVAVWAVIFGLVGGRLYHVITDNELYFRAGRDPWRAFYVWEGGLGVWGAIALGGVGAWIACHRRGITLPPFADAAAPGIAVAQGIGRWGNYFNQELFGRPTTLPWAVQIDPGRPSTVPGATTYHPTFLYESLWDLALAAVLIYVDRRYKMGRGRVFALYVMGYCAGRVWIESLRIDTANHVLGLRLNIWTSILVFAGALIYFLLHRGPRDREVEPGMVLVTPDGAEATDDAPTTTGTTAAPATRKDPTRDGLADADDDTPATTGATAAPATKKDSPNDGLVDADDDEDDDEPAGDKSADAKPAAEPVAAKPAEDLADGKPADGKPAVGKPAAKRAEDDDPTEDDLAAAERADDELAYGEPDEEPAVDPAAPTVADDATEPADDEPAAASPDATKPADEPVAVASTDGTGAQAAPETAARRRLLPAGRRKR